MPDPSVLTPLGLSMLAQLPPALRGSIDYQAAIHAMAREIEALEAAIETVRAQFNPATADALLNAWEFEVKLPVGGAVGASVADRRAAVQTRLRRRQGGSGSAWEDAITALIGPGWSYQEHDPANPSSPASGVVQVTLPYAPGDSQFIDASNAIKAITDAHLQLAFASSVLFHLDQSALDTDEFGA